MSQLPNFENPSFTWPEVGLLAKAAIIAQAQRLQEEWGLRPRPLDADTILRRALSGQAPGRYLVLKLRGKIWCRPQNEWPSATIQRGAEYWAFVRITRTLEITVLGESQ